MRRKKGVGWGGREKEAKKGWGGEGEKKKQKRGGVGRERKRSKKEDKDNTRKLYLHSRRMKKT